MINIDELLGHPHIKKKLDEQFILKHLMFKSLSEGQAELDLYFPGYKIIVDVHVQNGYLIINEDGAIVANIQVS